MIDPHQLTNTKTGRDPFNRLPSSPKNPLDKCTFGVSRFGGSAQCSRWRLLDPFDRRAPARVDLGDEDGRRLWDQSDVPDGILPDGPRDNSSTSTSRNSVGSPNPGTESPAEGQVTTTATSAGEPTTSVSTTPAVPPTSKYYPTKRPSPVSGFSNGDHLVRRTRHHRRTGHD